MFENLKKLYAKWQARRAFARAKWSEYETIDRGDREPANMNCLQARDDVSSESQSKP